MVPSRGARFLTRHPTPYFGGRARLGITETPVFFFQELRVSVIMPQLGILSGTGDSR